MWQTDKLSKQMHPSSWNGTSTKKLSDEMKIMKGKQTVSSRSGSKSSLWNFQEMNYSY